MTPFIAWLKARNLAEIALGGAGGFLAAGAMFSVIQLWMGDDMNDRAIENAMYQVADALTEAHKFRASLECTAHTLTECVRWEPRP